MHKGYKSLIKDGRHAPYLDVTVVPIKNCEGSMSFKFATGTGSTSWDLEFRADSAATGRRFPGRLLFLEHASTATTRSKGSEPSHQDLQA